MKFDTWYFPGTRKNHASYPGDDDTFCGWGIRLQCGYLDKRGDFSKNPWCKTCRKKIEKEGRKEDATKQ